MQDRETREYILTVNDCNCYIYNVSQVSGPQKLLQNGSIKKDKPIKVFGKRRNMDFKPIFFRMRFTVKLGEKFKN